MVEKKSITLKSVLKLGALLFILNEIRGLVMAGPVLYGIVVYGPTPVKLGALLGLVLSVLVPLLLWKKVNHRGV